DRAGALDLNGFYFLILDNHVLAFGDLIAADHIFPGDNFASLGIDVLLLQPVARFPVDPIKTYFFVQRGGGIERNGARDQRKPKIALPVRTRRHWILLNSTRRANYTANFSKCLRPLSGGCASMPARSLSAPTQFERSKWSLRTSQRPSSGSSSTILLTLSSS